MAITRLEINGRKYGVNSLNAMAALQFGTEAAALLAPAITVFVDIANTGKDPSPDQVAAVMKSASDPAKLQDLLKKALAQCFFAENNESFAYEDVFERHFAQYPGDLFELGGRAVVELARPFFPQLFATVQKN